MVNKKYNIMIIGGGVASKVIYAIIKSNNNFEVLGYFDKVEKEKTNIDYLGNDFHIKNNINQGKFVIGIGDPIIRKKIFNNHFDQNYDKLINIFHSSNVFDDNCILGSGNVAYLSNVFGVGSIIGNNNWIGSKSVINHDCKIGDNCVVSSNVALGGNTTIGDNTLIGMSATTLPGINIGDNCIIGAGSVVLTDVPNNSTYAGSPAKRIK